MVSVDGNARVATVANSELCPIKTLVVSVDGNARVATVANCELCPIKTLVVSVDGNARVVTIANALGGQKLQMKTDMIIMGTTMTRIQKQINIEIRTHIF